MWVGFKADNARDPVDRGKGAYLRGFVLLADGVCLWLLPAVEEHDDELADVLRSARE